MKMHHRLLRFHLLILLSVCTLNSLAESNRVGGDFELTTHQNKSYSLVDSRGQVVLLFFGFTRCPDVCPHTLSTIQSVLAQLGNRGQQIQPLFITVDPGHDTPAILEKYLQYFDSRFIGLTGSSEEIDGVVKQFSGFYSYDRNIAEGSYSVDHTSNLYIINTEGKVTNIVPYGTPSQAIIKNIENLLFEVAL